MSEVIVITSGKGGVGKTTTTANVGTGLAQLNKKVVLIDTDIGLRNLDVVMGLENRIVYNLVDVIEGNCRMKQALIKDKRYPNLSLLPSAQTRDKSAVSPEQMIKLIEELREEFDYILLDCPAGIEQGFKNAIAGVGHIIDIHHVAPLYHIHAQAVDNQFCLLYFMGAEKADNAICIADCGNLRRSYHQRPVSPCNCIFKSLLNSDCQPPAHGYGKAGRHDEYQ